MDMDIASFKNLQNGAKRTSPQLLNDAGGFLYVRIYKMPDKHYDFNQIKERLETHHAKVVSDFHHKHQQAIHNVKKHGLAIASTALLASSIMAAHPPDFYQIKHGVTRQQDLAKLDEFTKQLSVILKDKQTLNTEEENVIASALSKKFNMNLKVTLDGNRLNEIVGYIGAEQSLKRWAGDTLAQHDYQEAGMAPLQGAFKDFDNAEQEKYYVAVQLHELPDWNQHWSTLKPWYRYRKVFVYNPDNQKGIVAVIGDAGPAKWTGKTFGGSPEVMHYLNRVDGKQKGKVVILFIDDPENKIALGPTSGINDNLALNK